MQERYHMNTAKNPIGDTLFIKPGIYRMVYPFIYLITTIAPCEKARSDNVRYTVFLKELFLSSFILPFHTLGLVLPIRDVLLQISILLTLQLKLFLYFHDFVSANCKRRVIREACMLIEYFNMYRFTSPLQRI